MSIASEITRISGKVSDSFDAVVAKGGTVTSRKLDDLPTAIGTISGGTPTIPSYIAPKNNVNGVYKADNTATSFTLNGATDVSSYALTYAFQDCTNLTSVDLSSLTTISGNNGMNSCFTSCTGLTSVDLSSLTTISGNYGMQSCFTSCTGLTTVDLSSLTTISGNYGMQSCFTNCTGLTNVDLSSLTTISGNNGMNSCFTSCTGLTSVDLGLLTTISGSNAMYLCFSGCTGLTNVDLSSLTTISGTNEMQSCFTNCTGLTTVTIGGTIAIDFGTRTNQFDRMFSGCNQASGIDLYIATDEATLSQLSGYPSFGATCEVRIHYTAQ